MNDIIHNRRDCTKVRLDDLRQSLDEAKDRISGKACVYLTGSFARGEASKHSDLDLFITGPVEDDKRRLSRLDEICIKADLIQTTRDLSIPDFSGDGEYLQYYTDEELIKTLGRPEDDANNTFTARLLLLLESKCLLEENIYNKVIEDVISAYWIDYEDHKKDFMPAFLANDILRLWRTFCVNYEARTQKEPPINKAKRKLKNYKLKHSRLLTCYSALAYLSAEFASEKTVKPDSVYDMVFLSPTERLERLKDSHEEYAKEIDEILDCYAIFLRETDIEKEELEKLFLDKTKSPIQDSNRLGNLVYELLCKISKEVPNNFFHRLLLV